MPIQIDKILGLEGNKYEKTVAMIKYARFLSQKNDDSLEAAIGRSGREKITSLAINDILTGKVPYTFDPAKEEK
jgi:DNA-directed RNA polymerase subunit K/omega